MSDTRCDAFHWQTPILVVTILLSFLVPFLERPLLYLLCIFTTLAHWHYGTKVVCILFHMPISSRWSHIGHSSVSVYSDCLNIDELPIDTIQFSIWYHTIIIRNSEQFAMQKFNIHTHSDCTLCITHHMHTIFKCIVVVLHDIVEILQSTYVHCDLETNSSVWCKYNDVNHSALLTFSNLMVS